MNSLDQEIEEQSSQIYRDSYQMSIGELINIYRDKEMEIHPEFQRLYRWTDAQKTSLIESILLNIPIPSIFVSQDETGVWDIVDGVQRLSTIFQLVGELKDENDDKVQPLILNKTKYLPSLENYVWDLEQFKKDEKFLYPDLEEIYPNLKEISQQQRIDFKRSRIDIVIVKKESDPKTKYELFQRLNTGGTQLSDQEVRNCLLIMTNKDFFYRVASLDENIEYQNTTALMTVKKVDEQYRKELVMRLMVAYNADYKKFGEYSDLYELLNQESIIIAENKGFDFDTFETDFNRTFKIISDALGEDAFRRYDLKSKKFTGAFINGAFQAIAYGVLKNIKDVEKEGSDWLIDKIKKMYTIDAFESNMQPGTRAIPRFTGLSEFGKSYFSLDYEG